jgi:multidrug efflux pump subunit AcrA (membrane-fusion protein)
LVKRGDIIQSVDAVGEVFASNLVDVGAQVSGQIKELYVKVGDKVKAGDKIAQIDSIKQQNTLDQQLAALEILEARLLGSNLTQKITSAAVLFSGARGYLEGSKVSRLQREGNFVLIVTPSIKHLLKEISEVKAGRGCINSWKSKL